MFMCIGPGQGYVKIYTLELRKRKVALIAFKYLDKDLFNVDIHIASLQI